ncbi:MAG: sel1 repeat family protein [Gammaproteobacteria bacterium]|jgi:TPR repeat protein|nr:sel1 repeat family protein [Gammaproteobacteria bacterium]
MPGALTRRGWRKHIAALRSRARAGDISAVTALGLNLLEGIQDRTGRSLVRRNPRVAVSLLHRAATKGDAIAAGALGYAYDTGLGAKPSIKEAVRWYRRAVRGGNSTGAGNLATIYRDAGNLRLAFRWLMRSAQMGDGDSAVDVGYCYQYGIGTRKDAGRAKRQYRRAIASGDISQYGREEAMYHLALQYIDEGRPKLAVPLLHRATEDDDYPEAASVLRQITSGRDCVPCRCKRFINRALRGHAACELHG